MWVCSTEHRPEFGTAVANENSLIVIEFKDANLVNVRQCSYQSSNCHAQITGVTGVLNHQNDNILGGLNLLTGSWSGHVYFTFL